MGSIKYQSKTKPAINTLLNWRRMANVSLRKRRIVVIPFHRSFTHDVKIKPDRSRPRKYLVQISLK